MLIKKNLLSLAIIAAFAELASGCASNVSRSEVMERASLLNTEIKATQTAEAQRRANDEKLFVRVPTPYLSGRTVALSKDARLPAVFAKASAFERPPTQDGFTVPQVAALITAKFGIRVRVRPDIFLPASSLIPGSAQSENAAGVPGAPGAKAIPGMATVPMPPVPTPFGAAGASSPATAAKGGYETKIDFDFTGSLSDYLSRVSSKLGINWEWNEADQELVLYRLVRKTLTLDTSPASVTLSSSVTKGSKASTGTNGGTTGGATGTDSGAIGGNAQAAYNLASDAWASTVATLNRMRTQAGAVEPNPATRTITMIDTRDVVHDAESYIKQQNEILGRQVVLQVRLVRVSLARINQMGVSLDLVLNRLSTEANFQAATSGAGSLANSAAGALTYTVVSPTSTVSGSTILLNALREIGDVTDEFTQDVPVRNNRSVPISDFASFGYLAQTTPAATTGTTSATGLPGLTPGTVTSGTTVVLTPSISSGDSLSLLLSLDRSADPTFDSISAGSGSTLQQIQLPRQRGIKIDTEVAMKNNQTLVLMGLTKEGFSNTHRTGVSSVDNSAQGQREVQVLLITPRIVAG